MILRFLVIIGTVILVLILTINTSILANLAAKIPGFSNLITDSRIKGLAIKISPSIKNPGDILKNIQNAATPSTQKILQPLLNDLQKNAEQLPQLALNQLPRLIEIITNAKKEELYLISPKSLIVPQITDGQNQQLTLQLDTFEIRDTRKSIRPWNLTVYAKTEVALQAGITFKLKKENIKIVDGSIEGITIEEGPNLKMSSWPGQGKGTFRFNPFIIINLPKDFFFGDTKIEIESIFD